MNKSIIMSGILFFGSMIVGCSNEHIESKNTLMDSYVSLAKSNASDFNISNIKEDFKKYDFVEDNYYTLNAENNKITSNVNVYSFKDNSSQIDLELGDDNQLDLIYLSNNNNSLLKSIRINKDINSKDNKTEMYFDNIENRNKFINESKNADITSNNYELYTDIEKFICNNQSISFDEIKSKFNIEFRLKNTSEGINEYTYGNADNIKLMFDENSKKFIAVEYNYNGNKLYYSRFNNPNSQYVQEDIGIQFSENVIGINNILDGVDF